MVECLLTLRRIYEVERNDGKRSPRRPFALSPRSGTPNVSGHQPLRLSQRHSSPFLATPDVNYQAVQQVHSQCSPPHCISTMPSCAILLPHWLTLQMKQSQQTQSHESSQAYVQRYFGSAAEQQPGRAANQLDQANGVTRMMQQCTAMLRDRMGDEAGTPLPANPLRFSTPEGNFA